MGIHEQFYDIETKSCKKYGEKTLVFMQCGSFFETYGYKKGSQFRNKYYNEYSRITGFCMKEKNLKYKGLDVWMIGFPDYCLEKYVSKMTSEGFTIVIWVQANDPTKIRYEKCICSPGTDFDNIKGITNYSMCIWVKKTKSILLNKTPELICGMSAIDILTGDTHIFEYREKYFHNPTTFDEIERFYSSYNPSEILVIYETSDEEIKDILQFSQIECEKIHMVQVGDANNSHHDAVKKCEKQTYIKEQIKQFYDIQEYHVFCQAHRLDVHQLATQAFCFHLNFIYGCNPNLVKKLKKPLFDNKGDRLILGNHSLKQLNIVGNSQHRGNLSSVSNFINKCNTPMGKRKLHNTLIQPTSNGDELQRQYDITQYVKDQWLTFKDIRNDLKNIGDFERLYRKLILQRVAPAELSQFHNSLQIILGIYKTLKSDAQLNEHIKCSNLSKNCKELLKMLEDNLILTTAAAVGTVKFDVNIFKRGIFTTLDNCEKEYEENKDELECSRLYLERFIVKYKGKKTSQMIKYHETDKNGLFLSITGNRSNILKGELKKKEPYQGEAIKYNSTYNNEEKTITFNPHLVQYVKHTKSNFRLDSIQLNAIYHSIFSNKEKLKKELERVYKNFIISLQEYSEQIESVVKYVTDLDVVTTKAFLAIKFNYCAPVIDSSRENSFIKAKDMRHILIENLQEDETYVPNDIELGNGTEQNGILLYGTNAVGKSSLIRSIGICVIMAQAGLFVPCSEFVYKPYKSIFTRILGNDNLFKGLSTFAVEMSELRTILNNATKNSLVLGDELCSGTETTSATSIFMAGVIQLHNRNSSFIFATHFHEITNERRLKNLTNLSLKHMAVYYDTKEDCLVYNRTLQDGPGISMYGLEVCKSLHLPTDFLELANNIRKERSKDESILSQNTTRYNSKKLKGKCEQCDNDGVDAHHLAPQKLANKEGFIGTFHKNHKANIMILCKSCHDKETKNDTNKRRTKTTKGMRLLER
jgi:DNA mismatch repair protein MutS